MKKYFLLFLSIISCNNEYDTIKPVPTERQKIWQEMEYYAFIHFNMNTFTNMEWGYGDESPYTFNPSELDTDQWAKIIKESWMKGIIITAKHHDGFSLWPSKFTEHSVKNSPWKNGKGDRRMYSSLMESGGWIEVEDLVDRAAIAGLDVLSRELFRASSGALVMALLAQNQGAKSLAEFLGKVAVFEGEQMILLRTHFPQANLGPKGLERWWMLQVAALSEKKLSEAMTIPETDERLSGILELHLKNENEEAFRVSLGSWRQVAGLQSQEERIESIRPANDLLAHLSFRCFPTFRPVIAGYLKILSDVADGKTEEVEEMIRNLEEFRTAEVERHQKLVDLMDWYHLSSVRKESGEFEDYLKMQKNLRKGNEFEKDPLHQYLDKVQKVFEKPK